MAGMSTLQFRHRIEKRRQEGKPLTEEEINYITNESAERTHTLSGRFSVEYSRHCTDR